MSFVVNVEEGSEMSPAEGDRGPEAADELGVVLKKPIRNFGNERSAMAEAPERRRQSCSLERFAPES